MLFIWELALFTTGFLAAAGVCLLISLGVFGTASCTNDTFKLTYAAKRISNEVRTSKIVKTKTHLDQLAPTRNLVIEKQEICEDVWGANYKDDQSEDSKVTTFDDSFSDKSKTCSHSY